MGLLLGSEVVVTCSVGLTRILNCAFATLGGCSESETATVKLEPPVVVGVPDTTPARLTLRPGFNVPDATFQA